MSGSLIRVICCGNPDAGDDAAGLLVARMARDALAGRRDVEVVEAGPSVKVLDLLNGAAGAVVVDAVRPTRSSRRPGRIVRARVGPEGFPAELRSFLSSHGIGLADVIGLAVALGRTRRLVVLGVEVDDITVGHPLSEAVAKALPDLVEAIRSEVADMSGGSSS
jgi:hydrogenase maturation protease